MLASRWSVTEVRAEKHDNAFGHARSAEMDMGLRDWRPQTGIGQRVLQGLQLSVQGQFKCGLAI
jgi:hypothetical protein